MYQSGGLVWQANRRRRPVNILEALGAAEAPVRRPLETGDIDDPKPWLESYAAGVGSPLELKFLRLFEQ
jgi:hypothetical protein